MLPPQQNDIFRIANLCMICSYVGKNAFFFLFFLGVVSRALGNSQGWHGKKYVLVQYKYNTVELTYVTRWSLHNLL